MTYKEFKKLQERYNRPEDPEQQEKHWEYRRKVREIMKKPPNNRDYISIGINEIADYSVMGGEGYFYDAEEQVWCHYRIRTEERSNDISLIIYDDKKNTEEEAFQDLYESLEENVKRHERKLEREKNDRLTKEEFLEWFEQDNWSAKLAEKGPYRILWDEQPEGEPYAVGYYKKIQSPYYQKEFGDRWVAYVIINGKLRMECPYNHVTRAIYMMQYWIKLLIEGRFD